MLVLVLMMLMCVGVLVAGDAGDVGAGGMSGGGVVRHVAVAVVVISSIIDVGVDGVGVAVGVTGTFDVGRVGVMNVGGLMCWWCCCFCYCRWCWCVC